VVSTLKTGALIAITFSETVFHKGHYRVALAQDIASLPKDPPVTANSTSDCGSTTIDASPALPILGDGLAQHTTPFVTDTKTMQVQLPAGMTCSHCVLQVIEFMSDHGLNNPGGCFYHHCAIVDITDAGPQDAGVSMGSDGDSGHSSGGCSSGAGAGGSVALLGAIGAVLALRRRRRTHQVTR
jgi:MYXO-CTERM domain-containing protein